MRCVYVVGSHNTSPFLAEMFLYKIKLNRRGKKIVKKKKKKNQKKKSLINKFVRVFTVCFV